MNARLEGGWRVTMPKPTHRQGLAMRESKCTGNRLRAVAVGLTVVLVCGMGAGFVTAFGTRQTAVEEVVRRSDLIVLGQVISKDPHETTGPHLSGTFTGNTFKVEAYYKGEGPEEISILTHGGLDTDPNGQTGLTQVVGAEGVRVGEEFVALLKAGPGGYYFAGWGGNAKRMVYADPVTGERVVELRLSKKKYMRGQALTAFEHMEEEKSGPNRTGEVETDLAFQGGYTETIPIKDLSARLGEIIRGESIKINP